MGMDPGLVRHAALRALLRAGRGRADPRPARGGSAASRAGRTGWQGLTVSPTAAPDRAHEDGIEVRVLCGATLRTISRISTMARTSRVLGWQAPPVPAAGSCCPRSTD